MASLPKHLNEQPAAMWCDLHLAIDGGDTRQECMDEAVQQIADVMYAVCEKYNLVSAFSTRRRSVNPKQLRRQMATRGLLIRPRTEEPR